LKIMSLPIWAGLLLWSGLVIGVDSVKVLALFPHKAMVSIDGTSRVLTEGMTSKEGVKLIKATPYEAVMVWDGKQHTLDLHAGINSSYQAAKKKQVRILQDHNGSYSTNGYINGKPVDFLVDTGASTVTMSERRARQLGIEYRNSSQSVKVQTASEITSGYLVNLNRIKIGVLEEQNVDCTVIQGDNPPMVLLGMSFLNRVEIENKHKVMVLKKRY